LLYYAHTVCGSSQAKEADEAQPSQLKQAGIQRAMSTFYLAMLYMQSYAKLLSKICFDPLLAQCDRCIASFKGPELSGPADKGGRRVLPRKPLEQATRGAW
jgi:hypothetical protein